MYDIAIIGGGISGFTCAHRLLKRGIEPIVLESHGQPGGCAGFFTKKGFTFDVGATTLVDFLPSGIGGQYLDEVELSIPEGEYLDYIAWLPDNKVNLYRDRDKWAVERLEKLGNSKSHKKFWNLIDGVSDIFWSATRDGIKLPFHNIEDVINAVKSIGINNVYLAKYLKFTMLDVLKKYNLHRDKPLVGLLSMLIEDTLHSTIDKAPFINAALGITIRGAGLMRPKGGMKGFWDYITEDYLKHGGVLKRGNKVKNYSKKDNKWVIETTKGVYEAKRLVSSIPIESTYRLAPKSIRIKLKPYIEKNKKHKGSAIVVFLGVEDSNVSNQTVTHHQILQNYDDPLGNGNNMFISVSRQGDELSAPKGYRSIMISTHCKIEDWSDLSDEEYEIKKNFIGKMLIDYARKVYPDISSNPVVYKIGTPKTYETYTNKINGAVGGYKQTLSNTNFKAVPHNIGVDDFWLSGDTVWPGLGTVAGLVGSKIVADAVTN